MPPMADPSCGTEEAPFEAALVFTDPVDWYRDLQLLTDVIMSGRLLLTFRLVLQHLSCQPTCLVKVFHDSVDQHHAVISSIVCSYVRQL